MIIPQENLIEYLLNSDSTLRNICTRGTILKLEKWAEKFQDPALSIVDNLFLYHQDSSISLNKIAKQIGITFITLTRIFDAYNLPKLNKVEGVRGNWKDPEFRERHAEGVRQELYKRWEDPEFRRRNAEGVSKKGEDLKSRKKQFKDRKEHARERHAEAVRRQARLNPQKYFLPTIKGYRKDIGFVALSTWEANLARIFLYCKREVRQQELELAVTSEYSHLFDLETTSMNIDFVVKNGRGEFYKIMVPSPEGRKDWAKVEMLAGQYPDINLNIILPGDYRILERFFRDKINSAKNLAGWEDSEDNLKTNPTKYG